MKKKERVHLKEDPFANFIQSVLDKFQELKREIFIIGSVILAVGVIVIVVLLLRAGSISGDNNNFAAALEIWNSKTLTSDQKIEKLGVLKAGKGVSSAIHFYMASLYYEKGDFHKAKEVLAGYDGSSKLLDDQKKYLEAEIFLAMGEAKEGLDMLTQLLSDTRSEVTKDFLLLRIAKINLKDGLNKSAREHLTRLINEFPQSVYQTEARELLSEIQP